MTETLSFSISGDFITELARTWFWEEHRPIQTVLELIGNCMSGADAYQIEQVTVSILEGRKKLTGINVFQLEEDTAPFRSMVSSFRSMVSYMKEQEREKTIAEIRLDMTVSFRKYVDNWSTIKTSDPDILASRDITTYEDCKNWFTTTDSSFLSDGSEQIYVRDERGQQIPIIETPTMGGLWLINHPDLVYDACKGERFRIGKPEFWEQIYEQTKDWPAFKDRNERYCFSRRRKHREEERINNLMKMAEKEAAKQIQKMVTEEEPEYLTPEWIDYQYRITKDLDYRMTPDDLECWEGLIAPNGDFYSCGFAKHSSKAWNLLHYMPKRFPELPKTLELYNALDFIRDCGWCATRSVNGDHCMFSEHPTRAQIETMMKAAYKHDVSADVLTTLENY